LTLPPEKLCRPDMFNYRKIPAFPVVVSLVLTSLLWYQEAIYSKGDRFYGKKITRIDIEGNENVTDVEILDIIEVKPGIVLEPAMLDSDIRKIFEHEIIKNVRVEGEDYKKGVKLIFTVEERPLLSKITMKGVEELTESELLDLIPVRNNQVYDEQLVMRSVELLYRQYRSKGYMNSSVRVKTIKDPKKGNALQLLFIIDEGEELILSKINIFGTSAIEPEDLYKQMDLEEKGFANPAAFSIHTFESDKEKIIRYYRSQGYLDAVLLEASWEMKWENPVEKTKRVVIVNIRIREGEQFFFNGYDLEWDESALAGEGDSKKPLFDKTKILKEVEFSPVDVGVPFDDEKYVRDRSFINLKYSEKGYIFARMIPEQTAIPLTLEEIDKLEKSSTQIAYLKEGIDYYNIKQLRRVYEKEPQKRGKTFIHTKLVIYEGKKGFIESIIIKGNEKTKDLVIRREFLIEPGELFNADLVQRSREKIFNLGYFSAVNMNARPGSKPGTMNLLVEVEEQLTGTLSLGGGFSSLTGFSIFTEISENNIKGTGQKVRGKIQFGLNEVGVDVSWTEPWVFNVPWSLTVGAFYNHIKRFSHSINISGFKDFDTYYYYDRTGIDVRVGHRLGINWIHYHGFSPTLSGVTSPSSLATDEAYILERRGWQLQNKFKNGITFDNRDNIFNPTKGLTLDFSVDVVGNVLGGEDHYNRYSGTVQFYWWPFDYTLFNLIRKNLLRRYRIVFEHRLSASFTQQTTPAYGNQNRYNNPYVENYDRLFIGGYESLRGWLPLNDPLFPEGWQDGGSHRLLFSTELRFPLEPNLFWAVIFFDMGALFNDMNQYYIDSSTPDAYVKALKGTKLNSDHLLNMNYYLYSWGFGIRINLAMMPLRFFGGQRLIWDGSKNWFTPPPSRQNFEFVFGIGDKRF